MNSACGGRVEPRMAERYHGVGGRGSLRGMHAALLLAGVGLGVALVVAVQAVAARLRARRLGGRVQRAVERFWKVHGGGSGCLPPSDLRRRPGAW